MKSGWRTSEFWLTAAALVLSLLFASGVLGDGGTAFQVASVIAGVLGAMGYTVQRGALKRSENAKEATKAMAASSPPKD